MEYNYEIYTCNNGNPTAIITNCYDNEKYESIAEKIYDIHPEVDQAAVILSANKNECVFRLVNGEFCGNACLSISAYMYDNYKVTEINIINKIIDEHGKTESIEIKSKYDGNIGNLILPRTLFLSDNENEIFEDEILKMNGIVHKIIPNSYGEKNEEYAKKEIKELEKINAIPDVLGIIFLEENRIDPFIWIKRISLLQHQKSCLSGSIATLEYLHRNKKTGESLIYQPTGEAYDIKIKKNYIDITGIIRKDKNGKVEVK